MLPGSGTGLDERGRNPGVLARSLFLIHLPRLGSRSSEGERGEPREGRAALSAAGMHRCWALKAQLGGPS